jgi:superfamily I DNA/RNA helicase
MNEYTPSAEQANFYRFLKVSDKSVVLEAVAGAGKTETLARAVVDMPGYTTVMMFNKSAAEEFKSRLVRLGGATQEGNRIYTRKGLVVGTCHSVGLGVYKKWAGDSFDVTDRKVDAIIDNMCLDPDLNAEQAGTLVDGATFIKKAVSLAKQMLFGVTRQGRLRPHNDIELWLRMAQHYSIDSDLTEDMDVAQLTQLAIRVFEKSRDLCRPSSDRRSVIDYDDMIWAPLAFNCRFFTVDNVVGDEWQDANPARLELAARCLKPRGRMVACGDRRQAIYMFTGASSDSLDQTAKRFDAVRMPLTVTYRCPRQVVKFANTWMPEMVAHDGAAEGEVRSVLTEKPAKGKARPWYQVEALLPTDAILCRYNKPLVETAFKLIKAGTACKMEGRDIGQGLVSLVKRLKAKTIDALEARLEKWLDKEVAKARAKKSETREQSVRDRAECIMVFANSCKEGGQTKVECVISKIEMLFADDVKGILTLASGHKAKGREWSRVYWIQVQDPQRELQPHEEEQERNVKGVIASRAQQTLVLVPMEAK